jgi:hypothetical protein
VICLNPRLCMYCQKTFCVSSSRPFNTYARTVCIHANFCQVLILSSYREPYSMSSYSVAWSAPSRCRPAGSLLGRLAERIVFTTRLQWVSSSGLNSWSFGVAHYTLFAFSTFSVSLECVVSCPSLSSRARSQPPLQLQFVLVRITHQADHFLDQVR